MDQLTRFPKEFEALLNDAGRRILHGRQVRSALPLALLTDVLDGREAARCRRLLDHTMRDHVRQVRAPIPKSLIASMTRSFEESLPKTLRFKTSYLRSRQSLAYRAADEVGLLQMMRSDTLRLFAESVTGLTLQSDDSIQVILYEPGDGVGPHNDNHPDIPGYESGYVDVHIMFTSPAVQRQFLVCEDGGFFSADYDIALDGVAVYRLPFWHYVTPLRAVPRRAAAARRWLLLHSFRIAEPTVAPTVHSSGRSTRHGSRGNG